MLYIRPIMDKELQRKLCEESGAIYNEENMAYFASESDDCGKTINRYLGVLQFSIEKDATLESITQMPGVDDEEAVIIMERAMMSFLYRDAGIKTLICGKGIEEKLAKKLGFREKNGGYAIDLEEFFKSPCHYGG